MFLTRIKYIIAPKKLLNFTKNLSSYQWSKITKQPINSAMPTFLSIEISSKCNLNCPQCACGIHSTQRSKILFDFDTYTKIVEQTAPYLHSMLLYFQGEPTLHPQLYQFISLANSKHIFTSISTNAQLIDSDKAKQLVQAGLKHIIISMDGTSQQTYETYRQGGSLQKTIQAISHINYWKKQLKSNFPYIELQMIVFKHNEHQIEEFKNLKHKVNVNKVTLKSAQLYLNSTLIDFLPKNKKYTRYALIKGKWQLKHPLKNHCYKLWAGGVITTDGLFLPCCFDKLAQHPFGSIYSQSIAQIWNGTNAQHFRYNLLHHKKQIDICNNCNQ